MTPDLTYAEMLFLREDPRVRGYLLRYFEEIRRTFSTINHLNDDDFLRYLVSARVIGFSLNGIINEVVDLFYPPVTMVGSSVAMVIIDLTWTISYLLLGKPKVNQVPYIRARSLTMLNDETCAFLTYDHCYGLLRIREGRVLYNTNHPSYGRVRQIMGAYLLTTDDKLYHVILNVNDSIRLQPLSSSCAFIIETQSMGSYERVTFRHIDGHHQCMFSYGERFVLMPAQSFPGRDVEEVKLAMLRKDWRKHGLVLSKYNGAKITLEDEKITVYHWGFYRLFTYDGVTYVSHKHACDDEKQTLVRVDENLFDVTSYLSGSKGSHFYALRY